MAALNENDVDYPFTNKTTYTAIERKARFDCFTYTVSHRQGKGKTDKARVESNTEKPEMEPEWMVPAKAEGTLTWMYILI